MSMNHQSENTRTMLYQDDNEKFEAFVAYPKGTGPHPAVLICHAWGGRDAFTDDKARKLAELGYVGIALDLYGVGKRGHDRASNEALMTPLVENPSMLRRRLQAAHDAASSLDGVDKNRMAMIGYCFGGLCAIFGARMGLPLKGVVSFHGLLEVCEQFNDKVQARILVLHGQDDPMATPAAIGKFAEEMKRINADWELHAYPGVMHAFTNPKANDPDFGTVYNESADRRSWVAMRRFLEDVFSPS